MGKWMIVAKTGGSLKKNLGKESKLGFYWGLIECPKPWQKVSWAFLLGVFDNFCIRVKPCKRWSTSFKFCVHWHNFPFFEGQLRLMLKKMIININTFSPYVNVYFYQEFLLYKSVSPGSSGREGQNWSILEAVVSLLPCHVALAPFGMECEETDSRNLHTGCEVNMKFNWKFRNNECCKHTFLLQGSILSEFLSNRETIMLFLFSESLAETALLSLHSPRVTLRQSTSHFQHNPET